MRPCLGIQVVLVCVFVSRLGLSQAICGTQYMANYSCGSSDYTVDEKEPSTFYQLNGSMVRLRPPKTAPRPPNTINVWQTRRRAGAAETSIAEDLHLQVRQSEGNVIIYPMDVRVDGAQYKYIRQFLNGTRVYETDWTTARLGTNVSVTVDMGGMLKVRVGASLNNPVTVTGVPNPTCCLKKDDDLSVKCQPDILQLDPAEESDHGRYSVVVSNCFNSDTESFVVDVLTPPSTDTADGNISAVCGEPVEMQCNGSGNPQPSITWTFMPVYSSQPLKVEAPNQTALGWMKYQSVLSLYNVRSGKSGHEGTYQCLINNTIRGAQKVIFMLSVTCTPDPPGLEVLGVTNVSIILLITAPSYTGGLSLKNYSTYVDENDRPIMTMNANATSDRMEIVIGGLDSKTGYTFFVRACNDIGKSEAAEVSTMTDGVLDKPTVSLISVQCGYVEFIISSNDTGVSPTLNYSVIFTTSGGNVQTKTIHVPVVRINLQGEQLYTITISVRNKFGDSLVSDPFMLETSEFSCSSSSSNRVWIWIVIAVGIVETVVFVMCTVYVRKTKTNAVAKASIVTEMKERSKPATAVVYESVDEGRLRPGEVLTESPLYQLHGTVETNVS